MKVLIPVLLALGLAAAGLAYFTVTPLEAPGPVSTVDTPKPKLVLAVVLDQFGTWALEKHLPYLPEDGVIRRAVEGGLAHRRVRYPYGATITAAGHATLHTGVAPSVHGVVANDLYDPERGEKRALVDDGEHAIFGTDGFAGPAVLEVPTVGDALEQSTEGKAKVVALSIKDRASVLPAGRKADIAVFYDKRIPGFTTSSFYAKAIPEWLATFSAAHPTANYFGAWEPLEISLTAGIEDDRAVEGSFEGFDRTFPHDPKETKNPGSALRFFPASTDFLLELARAAVKAYDMGGDDVPDLLSVSVSATDYVGHKFGADSLEYLDNLIRADRALGAFVRELEKTTELAVLISSDHGHAPTPNDPAPARIFPPKLLEALDAHLSEKFGEGSYGTGYHVPYLYLSPEALKREDRDAILAETIRFLEARPDVKAAAKTEDAAEKWAKSEDPQLSASALGIKVNSGGPIYVVPAEGAIVDTNLGDGGTTHGTPWLYDRDVPVLGFGVGIERVESSEAYDIRQYASSLCKLLDISCPAKDALPALPGIR